MKKEKSEKKGNRAIEENDSYNTFFHALNEMVDVSKFFRAYCYRSVIEQGFTVNEIDVLLSLKQHPEKNTVKGISETMHLSKGMISQAVESLRKKKMLTIDPNVEDRRSMFLHLSQKAMPVLEKVKESSSNFVARISSGIPAEQLFEISKVVAKIRDNKESMKMTADAESEIK